MMNYQALKRVLSLHYPSRATRELFRIPFDDKCIDKLLSAEEMQDIASCTFSAIGGAIKLSLEARSNNTKDASMFVIKTNRIGRYFN